MRTGFASSPRNLADPELYRAMSEDDIKGVIRNGKGQMPAFGKAITEAELTNLVAYLRTLPLKR